MDFSRYLGRTTNSVPPLLIYLPLSLGSFFLSPPHPSLSLLPLESVSLHSHPLSPHLSLSSGLLASPASVVGQVRCLSHVPVDDIISGLTPEQIEVWPPSYTRSYSHSVMQPFCRSSILPCSHSVMQPFCHSYILPCIHSVIHPFCCAAILSFTHSVIQPFCHSHIL